MVALALGHDGSLDAETLAALQGGQDSHVKLVPQGESKK